MNDTPSQTNQPPDDGEAFDVCQCVVAAIAESTGTSPLDVHPPLATVVDPDALDDLVTSMARNSIEETGRIEFTYSDHHVTVTSTGDVFVTQRADGD